MNRAWPSLQSGRCDFDAVVLPDHYDPGTDDLSFVIREHFQLPLDQQFHVLEDVGEITWRSGRIEAQVSFLVLLKLSLPRSEERRVGKESRYMTPGEHVKIK